LVARQEIEEKIPEQKVQKQKSLKEITEEITRKIERYIKLSFSELVLTADKKETAASFISILELFRNGFVDLGQKEDFGEIMIEKKDPGSVLYRE
jgi:chromatin segregation and condensation protein Rec8/ScpA/Scc1 (kleisin family)